jgi:hypothetical protein
MVKANKIKHVDGNGAALNEIANPPFLKVVSRIRSPARKLWPGSLACFVLRSCE